MSLRGLDILYDGIIGELGAHGAVIERVNCTDTSAEVGLGGIVTATNEAGSQ